LIGYLLYCHHLEIVRRPPGEKEVDTMKYVCNICGWVYDEDEAGVKWEDLPEDFACEVCGVGKEDFSPEE